MTRLAAAAVLAAAALVALPSNAGASQPDTLHGYRPSVHVLPYSERRDYAYLRDVYGRLEVAHAGAYHGKPVPLIGEAREICDDLAVGHEIDLEFPAHTRDRRIVVSAAARHLCPTW